MKNENLGDCGNNHKPQAPWYALHFNCHVGYQGLLSILVGALKINMCDVGGAQSGCHGWHGEGHHGEPLGLSPSNIGRAPPTPCHAPAKTPPHNTTKSRTCYAPLNAPIYLYECNNLLKTPKKKKKMKSLTIE